uniref:Uncharacterized protein n=1 Tax=Avena sativa TaxID=4498 RepID=A0ACD5XY45_AVESA
MLISGRAKDLDVGSHDYIRMVQPFFQKWASDYGKTFLYWLGPIPSLCCSDMELVKQVLTERTDLFEKEYLNRSLDAILGNGVIFANGDDWRRRRKFVHPAFSQEKIKSMAAITSECTKKMMEGWCSEMQDGSSQQAEIDMTKESDEISMGVIARVMLGKNYKEAWEVCVAGKEQLRLATYAFNDPPIPGFRHDYLPTRRNRRTWQLNKLVTSKISKIIQARVADGVYEEDDLLGLMLEARQAGAESLTAEEMIGECKTFFAAGFDTTATLLNWAMFLLASYPRWQEMLNMLLLETLRLYSPISFLHRRASCDTVLGNIKVPKGTMVTIPLPILHRDKEVWGQDADEFNPLRFENGLSKASTHRHALLAFSYGPRICAGQNFAMVEVHTMIAMIVKRFSFSLSPRYVHKPSNFVTLTPRYGLPLILRNLQLDG